MTQSANIFDGLYFQNGRYKYEFREQQTPIGKGSYGVVFKARNIIDDKNYAIKKIRIAGKLLNKIRKKLVQMLSLTKNCLLEERDK